MYSMSDTQAHTSQKYTANIIFPYDGEQKYRNIDILKLSLGKESARTPWSQIHVNKTN